ncbi:hypothetical protein PTKIN_Ptkin11bG0043000 [Pterospermum kingtungense]
MSGLKKEQGCSAIEADGVIHEFLAGDNSHPLSNEIYSKLEEIVERLKSVGYVPNKSHLLQLIEEDELQEHALKQIRIIKNLRVCGDCHSVAKLLYLDFIIER